MQKANPFVAIALLLTFCCHHATTYSQQWIIVFDLTNTLLRVDEQSIEGEVPGFTAGLAYTIWNLSANPRGEIEKKFRKLLESLNGPQQGADHQLVRGQDHHRLPLVLLNWLSGNISGYEIVQRIKSKTNYKIFVKIAETIFNAELVAKHTHATPGAPAFVEQCVRLVGSQHLYIAANWEQASLSYIAGAKPFFRYIPAHQRLISGTTHKLLPRDAEAVAQIISERSGSSRDHIIFVSAMPYHIQAMSGTGVNAILVHQGNLPDALNRINILVQAR